MALWLPSLALIRMRPGLAFPFLAKILQMFDEDVRLFDESFNNRTEIVGSVMFINLQEFINGVGEGVYLIRVSLSRGLHGVEFHQLTFSILQDLYILFDTDQVSTTIIEARLNLAPGFNQVVIFDSVTD
jgi:hypothetical protein